MNPTPNNPLAEAEGIAREASQAVSDIERYVGKDRNLFLHGEEIMIAESIVRDAITRATSADKQEIERLKADYAQLAARFVVDDDRTVTREMALDAGDPSMEGQPLSRFVPGESLKETPHATPE